MANLRLTLRKLNSILHEPLPETIKRALARLKFVLAAPIKPSDAYWRRYY